MEFFRKAAERGHPVACAFVGRSYFSRWGGNSFDAVSAANWYARAFPKLPELANAGDSEAQVAWGVAFRYGPGVKANPEQAAEWFPTAIKLENSEALWELGSLYEEGAGVSKDLDEMFRIYRRSAQLGNARGILCLATAYSLGVGTAKDLKESLRWYEQAALLMGIPEGRNKLKRRVDEFYRSATEHPTLVSSLAWQIFQLVSSGTWKDDGLISKSLDAAKAAANKLSGNERVSCLDTVARLLDLQGDVEAAIKIQEEAVQLVMKNYGEDKEAFVDFLESLGAKKK